MKKRLFTCRQGRVTTRKASKAAEDDREQKKRHILLFKIEALQEESQDYSGVVQGKGTMLALNKKLTLLTIKILIEKQLKSDRWSTF